MPPRRPLPDLCVITALKFLEPMDQLTASKMSFRFGPLVRAANRTVKTLVITNRNLIKTQRIINSFFISSRPNLQQLTDDRGKAIDLQPKAVRVNRWNSLKFRRNYQEDLPTVEEISTVLFSAVTSLMFIADDYNADSFDENCQYLIELLQHPHLANQLESLVLRLHGIFSNKETSASGTYELMAALNSLTSLQQLVMDFDFWFDDNGYLPALTVLAQLKVLWVMLEGQIKTAFFLDAIAKQADDNVDLQIHLQVRDAYYLSKYIDWREPLFSRVVSLGLLEDRFPVVSELFPLFPSLTSLTLITRKSFSTNYGPLLALLSQHNRQLLYLGWKLNLVDQQNLDRSSTPPVFSLPQLTSVRAVTLDLNIGDHSQVEWLHLPWTLPNCQAIHLRTLTCERCRVDLWKVLRGDYYTEESKPTNSAIALQCLRDVLSKLYPHFQRQQITWGKGEPYYRTAAELFAEQ